MNNFKYLLVLLAFVTTLAFGASGYVGTNTSYPIILNSSAPVTQLMPALPETAGGAHPLLDNLFINNHSIILNAISGTPNPGLYIEDGINGNSWTLAQDTVTGEFRICPATDLLGTCITINHTTMAALLPGILSLATSSDLNFVQSTNGVAVTVSQTGTAVTLSPGATSAYFGGWLVPASGTAERLVGYNGTATMQASLSQTIAGGTSATIYYDTGNADLTQSFPASKTFFGSGSNFNFVTFGADSNDVKNWLGSGIFNNGLAIGNATNVPANRVTTSGNPTASQSGTTVTASSSVFSATSVGRMIMWHTGQTALITAFTNGTTVTVEKSQTVAASQFILTPAGATVISSEGNFGTNNAYIYNSLNMLSHAISNVLDPTNAQDAATKNYVDGRTTIHYLELNKSGTQSITLNTATPITYATSIVNTFGSALTITGNNTFTNASGTGMYLTVSTVTAIDASQGGGVAMWVHLKLTRALGANTTPACGSQDIFSAIPMGCTHSFYLANGDSFQVIDTSNGNTTLGTSTADSSGQTYKTSITILQTPGA